MDKKQLRVHHQRDAAWADLRQYEDDIDRISKHGPQNEREVVIIQKVLFIVSAELMLRKSGEVV